MNSVESFWKSVDGLDEFLQGIFLGSLWMVWMDSLLDSVWMNFYGKVLGSLLEGFLDSLDEKLRKVPGSLRMNFCGKKFC
jgi:hypothetical protein